MKLTGRSDTVQQDMNKIKAQIKDNINILIDNGNLQEAKTLIGEYRKMVPDDIDVYSMDAVIAIMEGNFLEAEIILNHGLKKDCNNFDLNYNLAYIFKQKGMYLKALETYEKIVFNMEDCGKRQQTIEYLNKFEYEYRDIIQKQLEQKSVYSDRYEKKVNLHLMYDSSYCDKFIHFVNENFSKNEHRFIIIGNVNEKLKYMNIIGIENVKVADLRYDLKKLLNYIDECSRIFIHYLFDYFCELVCKFSINKPIYWALWGGDLYNYINFKIYDTLTEDLLIDLGYDVKSKLDKNRIEYVYRKSTIRNISYVLSGIKGDYEELKVKFCTKAKYIKFFYPNTIEFAHIGGILNTTKSNKRYSFKDKYKYVFLVGNSANPSNNHLDILLKLSRMKSEDFCVIVPLSYGGSVSYVNYLISKGKELLGKRFIAITDYLNQSDYYNILYQVDVGVFNNNRQQALGNINSLLYLGKKVFVKADSAIYDSLVNLDIKIYDILQLDNRELQQITYMDNLDRKRNKDRILFNFSNDESLKFIVNLMNN